MNKNMPSIKTIIAIIFIVTICGGIVFAWYDVSSDADLDNLNMGVAGVDSLDVYMKIEPWGVETDTSATEETATLEEKSSDETTTVDEETSSDETTTVDEETSEDETTTVDGETSEDETTTVDGETSEDETTTVDGETSEDETTTVDEETSEDETTTVDGETSTDETSISDDETSETDATTPSGTTTPSETTTPQETTEEETTRDGVTKMEMSSINPNAAVIDIGLEDLTNIEKGMLAPGAYGQFHFYITNKSVDMNGFDISITPKYKIHEAFNGNNEELIDIIESHILFFGEKTNGVYSNPLTIDSEGKLSIDGEYIVGSTMKTEGELELNVEKEVIVYWYWPYEYGDVPGIDASSVNEDSIRKYDLEDTMMGNYLTSFSLHFEVKGKYYD